MFWKTGQLRLKAESNPCRNRLVYTDAQARACAHTHTECKVTTAPKDRQQCKILDSDHFLIKYTTLVRANISSSRLLQIACSETIFQKDSKQLRKLERYISIMPLRSDSLKTSLEWKNHQAQEHRSLIIVCMRELHVWRKESHLSAHLKMPV